MHFFNDRLKSLFELRDTRARQKNKRLKQRLKEVFSHDEEDSLIHRRENFNYV